MTPQPPVRFAVISMNHGHVYGQVNLLLRAGAELVASYATEPDLADAFARAYPQARAALSPEEILEDRTVELIVTAAVPYPLHNRW